MQALNIIEFRYTIVINISWDQNLHSVKVVTRDGCISTHLVHIPLTVRVTLTSHDGLLTVDVLDACEVTAAVDP